MSNNAIESENPPPQTNGHDQYQPIPTTNGGSGGGFTAVNGLLNRPTTSTSIRNTTEGPSAHEQAIPHPIQANSPVQPYSPPQQQTLPPISAALQASTNGTALSESTRSSPVVNAIYPRRPSSSESIHSPPRRKRSYPEAFGDGDDSSEPKKEKSPGPHDYYHNHFESEEQKIASEALRRESDESHRRESALSNGEDRDDRGYHDYERTPAGALIDADRKKRKRVFSNRTKTGCMTCRKRKKKCDEAHPECNNCLRGGFVCEGYSTRNTWQKPNAQKAPIPLQSKDGLSPYQHSLAQPQHTPIKYSDEYGNRPDIRPIDEPRRLSPHREQRQSWPGPQQPQHPAYPGASLPPPGSYADRGMDSRPPLPRVEALHEHPEYPASQMAQRPSHGPPVPPLQHQSPSGHPHHQSSMPGPPQQSNLPPILDAPPQQRPGSHHRQQSERDKMLRGEYFLPYTPALMADRDQCALAVWRFNNSTNPTMGIKLEDRMNFFKEIVNLRPSHEPDSMHGPQDPNDPPIVGSVGTGVIVEAPFSCDYGYNITIGNDVVIGADCRITDTCSVHIGNNVVFSPGVRLMCATYAIDPKERKKGKGRALGRQIVIEDDVWIGSNVIILPGVKIGRCTTIGAGSLLHKDVPPYVVVAGNPPKVVRGIYDDGRAS